MIDCYAGLDNVQSGIDQERGVCNAEELDRICALAEFDEQSVPFKYVIIKVRPDWIERRGDLYHAVRSAWVAKLDKVKNYPYVLATVGGVVKELYKVDEWHYENDTQYRVEFDGVERGIDVDQGEGAVRQGREIVRIICVNYQRPAVRRPVRCAHPCGGDPGLFGGGCLADYLAVAAAGTAAVPAGPVRLCGLTGSCGGCLSGLLRAAAGTIARTLTGAAGTVGTACAVGGTATGALSRIGTGCAASAGLAGLAEVFELLRVDTCQYTLVARQAALGSLGNVQVGVQVR